MATTTISPTFSQRAITKTTGAIITGTMPATDEAFCRWENFKNARVDTFFYRANPNALEKNGGVAGNYDGGATSIQKVSGADTKASVTLEGLDMIAFGLSSLAYNPVPPTRDRIEWCVELAVWQSQLKFYEQGIAKGSITSYFFHQKSADTIISVRDTGADIQVFENDTSVFTFPGTTSSYSAGKTYYFDCGLAMEGSRMRTCKLEGTYV